MSPPPDGVNTQFRWPGVAATRTYSLYGEASDLRHQRAIITSL